MPKVRMNGTDDDALQVAIRSDPDNPELTDAEIASLRPASQVLPASLYVALTRKPGQRGPGKKPPKEVLTIRLDRDLVERMRAMGAGWQTRANAALRDAFMIESEK